jgi:uncharacterized protein YuzE
VKTTYYPDDDILVVRLSDAPVAREVSQSWNVNISYDADGRIVQIVVLEAKAHGAVPVESLDAA